MLFVPVERISSNSRFPPWIRYQHLQRYAWASSFAKGKSVLDAAAGAGYGTIALADADALSVCGLDICEIVVRHCRITNDRLNVKYVTGDVTALPMPNDSFDLYVSFETIEHVRCADNYLSEARRVLRNDGLFLCSTPNRIVMNAAKGVDEQSFNPFHVREYTADEFLASLLPHFSTVHLYGQSFYRASYVRCLQWLGRRSRFAAVRAHQLRKLLGVPFDTVERHVPKRLGGARIPEILLAVCQ